jgi:beta-aspartyl-peptidase (threonine type)
MEYKGLSIDSAANLVIKEKLVKAGGEGGIIGVDKFGNIAMIYNTTGMFRAFAKADGKEGVFIFGEERGERRKER